MRLRIGELPENSQLALNLRGYGRHLVTQTQIKGHVRTPAPVVLKVGSYDGLAKSSLRDRARNRHTQRERPIGQKIRQQAERKFSTGVRNRKNVVPDAVQIHPELNRMSPFRQGDIVRGLDGGPVETEIRRRPEAARKE